MTLEVDNQNALKLEQQTYYFIPILIVYVLKNLSRKRGKPLCSGFRFFHVFNYPMACGDGKKKKIEKSRPETTTKSVGCYNIICIVPRVVRFQNTAAHHRHRSSVLNFHKSRLIRVCEEGIRTLLATYATSHAIVSNPSRYRRHNRKQLSPTCVLLLLLLLLSALGGK